MPEMPKMTYYARVLDNVTGDQIAGWTDSHRNALWYYGRCNGFGGGESEYIVEFDIWNNEPVFNAGMYDNHNADALNCRVTTRQNETQSSVELWKMKQPFMFARCNTFSHKEPFVPIRDEAMLENITGNVNANRIGVIQGCGDHALVQTKIILPKDAALQTGHRYGFDFVFYYEFM